MKTPEMDLLDLCACRLGCQYLSDLRGLQGVAAGPAGRGPAGRGGGGGPPAGVERRVGLPDREGPAASPEEARARLIGRLAPEGRLSE